MIPPPPIAAAGMAGADSSGFSAQSVTLWRGSRQILRSVSLSLGPGECLAIVGPNGAGKSSLLKVFSGDLIPQSGEVSLDGIPIPAWNRGALAHRRAVLPQHSELLFPFPVRDVVQMGRSPHRERTGAANDAGIVDEAMAAVDVFQFQDRPYDRLSGGERQRVQLARILAQVWPEAGSRHGFLLLDEPTSSLDLSHQHALLQIVRRFTRIGLGALIVLHDLNLAMQYADRAMVMHHGRNVACGAPEKALDSGLIREVFNVEARALSRPGFSRPLLQFQATTEQPEESRIPKIGQYRES